jgi:hypothetical protein
LVEERALDENNKSCRNHKLFFMEHTYAFHYPPELFELLIQTIPLLFRGKKDVVLFFRGAGVPDSLCADLSHTIQTAKDSITKYDIARTLLTRINEENDIYLRQRREILKRISEFEAFTNCWPKDQMAAKGYVAEVQKVVKMKDAFTRMEIEREKEQLKHRQEQQKKVEAIREKADQIEEIKKKYYSLFAIENPHERGKKLEEVLNSLFTANGILVRDAFTICGSDGEGVIEQVDGAVEIDGHVYLVEMKWHGPKISNRDVLQHLGRIYSRPRPNGIFISSSGFTDSAIIAARDGLIRGAMFILMDFEEFIKIFEHRLNLVQYVREKILKALTEKEPYHKPVLQTAQ